MKYSIETKNKAIELYKLEKSLSEISKQLNIHTSIIHRWIVNAGIIRTMSEACKLRPQSKYGFSQEEKDKRSLALKGKYKGEFRWNFKKLKEGYNNSTSELSYILGVLYGDGFISSNRNDEIGLQVIDKDFIDEFARCLKSQFGYDASIYEYEPRLIQFKGQKQYMQSKSFTLRFTSVASKEFIESIKNWDYIFKLSDEHKKDFIRGLWDSEGTIGINDNKYCQIKFCIKNKDLAEKYQKLLYEILDIDSHINPAKNGMFYVNFSKTVDVIKFYKEIKPTIKRKKEIIERVLKCNPN